ncbi:MAG: ATPase [Oceanospirillaceae bacterium]|mgnify:CR=1 FL=1|nr:ATPase [Oceanospirillaceae bacterium]|tara:strand:- start:2560 stop:3699 length:1140 start_codon:yes stop_codon:yes gene_type:complete
MTLRAITLLAVLLGTAFSAHADEKSDSQRLKEVQAEIRKLEAWLKDARSEYDDLQNELRASDKEISALTKQVNETRARLAEEQQRLKKLREEQAQQRQLRQRHQQLLSQQIREARRIGDEAAVRFWLTQDDPAHNQRMLHYFSYFNRARVEHIHDTMEELRRLDNIEALILEQETALKKTEAALLTKNRALEGKKQDQQVLLARLSKQMSSESSRLEARQADQKRLQALLEEVANLISDSPLRANETPFKDMRGKLPLPVAGRITKAFGSRADGGKSRWEGWQISTTEGTPVKAVHHGRVVFADWLRGFGLLIIVDHGKGYLSLYAHNQSLLKDVGNWVNAGDQVATAGHSGGLTSAALYFEIRYQGRPQDPALWLKRG